MNQLVIPKNNQPVTTSRMVAGKFNKQHRRVLQDIRNLECSEKFTLHHFVQGSYIHPKNKQEFPEYIITKDGFTFLVMGYTGKEAAKFKEEYIEAFNDMYAQLKEQPKPSLPVNVNDGQLLLNQSQNEFNKIACEMILNHQSQLSQLNQLIGQLKCLPELQQELKHCATFVKSFENGNSFITTREFAQQSNINLTRDLASTLGKRATQMCKELDIEVKKRNHDVFDKVNAYPYWILRKAYDDITLEDPF